MFKELVDVKEDNLLQFDCELLSILLKDKTSGKNIIWATDNYIDNGYGYSEKDYITIEKITGHNGQLIKPRTKKTKTEQLKRSRDKAEVFTPSWICNKQNNLVDSSWFQKKNVFNIEFENSWETIDEKIEFPADKTWYDYISLKRLEVSCGEAPYLVSRYDTVTGEIINIKNRIGLMDRKFRILNENASSEEEWLEYSKEIVKSIYAFDWQGDNVFLSRENILYTYADYYKERYKRKPSIDLIKEIAEIISWNIWQMDGINYIIPHSCKNDEIKCTQLNIFGEEEITSTECAGCKKNNIHKHNGTYSKIMNWDTNRTNKFINLTTKGG